MGDDRHSVPRALIPKRIVATLGVLLFYFHLAAVISRSLPNPDLKLKLGIIEHSLGSKLQNLPGWALYYNRVYIRPLLFERYLSITGFDQNWSMFAPNPIQHDTWVDAVVVFKSGTQKEYEYPRNSRQNFAEKLLYERYAKYLDTAQKEQNAFLWPPLADFVARQNYTDPADPPVQVMLRRWVRTTPPPGSAASSPEPQPFVFFDTPIPFERLSR